jgi:hypothetical protein
MLRLSAWGRSTLLLWLVFAGVSLVLAWLGYVGESLPYGDVSYVYQFWAGRALGGAEVVGISTQWVYPVLALLPILFCHVAGAAAYPVVWISLVTLANAATLWLISGGWRVRLRRPAAAWWFVVFLLCLGPISVARLDSLVTPLAVAGLLLVATRPALATSCLTVGAWIKVWPAAFVLAAVGIFRTRVRMAIAALTVTGVIIAAGLAAGAGRNLFSFLTEQGERGLQIEAPSATWFLWMGAAQVPGYGIYYDQQILTFQVLGPQASAVASLSTPLLAAALALVALLTFRTMRRGSSSVRVFPALALALVMCLIVFNKVGSPQYMGWLSAPIVAGMVYDRRRFVVPAVLALGLGLLTHAFYPYFYLQLLELNPVFVTLLTARNLGEIALLIVSVRLLATSKTGVSLSPSFVSR